MAMARAWLPWEGAPRSFHPRPLCKRVVEMEKAESPPSARGVLKSCRLHPRYPEPAAPPRAVVDWADRPLVAVLARLRLRHLCRAWGMEKAKDSVAAATPAEFRETAQQSCPLRPPW